MCRVRAGVFSSYLFTLVFKWGFCRLVTLLFITGRERRAYGRDGALLYGPFLLLYGNSLYEVIDTLVRFYVTAVSVVQRCDFLGPFQRYPFGTVSCWALIFLFL